MAYQITPWRIKLTWLPTVHRVQPPAFALHGTARTYAPTGIVRGDSDRTRRFTLSNFTYPYYGVLFYFEVTSTAVTKASSYRIRSPGARREALTR